MELRGLVSLVRAAAQGVRARGRAPAVLPPARELRAARNVVHVDPRRVARFLRVTEGGRIEAFARSGLLPPVFPSVWEGPLLVELFAQLGVGLPLGGVIHTESELCNLRPLHVDSCGRCGLQAERLERSSTGLRMQIVARTWDAAGRLCLEEKVGFLLRYRDGTGSRGAATGRGGTASSAPIEAVEDNGWTELARWKLRSGLGRRYARVSGDYNPIHLSRLTALPFGYRRPVLHGFCLEAMVAHGLIEHCFAGEPQRLRRLRIAFRKPLLLPAKARLLVVRNGAAGRFRVSTGPGTPDAEGEFSGA